MVEKVVYTADVPGKTVASRSAWIDSQVFGFATAIRAFGCERFKKNCQKSVSWFIFKFWVKYLTIFDIFRISASITFSIFCFQRKIITTYRTSTTWLTNLKKQLKLQGSIWKSKSIRHHTTTSIRINRPARSGSDGNDLYMCASV